MEVRHNNTFLLPSEKPLGMAVGGLGMTPAGELYIPSNRRGFYARFRFSGDKKLVRYDQEWERAAKVLLLPDQQITSVSFFSMKRKFWTARRYYNQTAQDLPWLGEDDERPTKVVGVHHESGAYYSCIPPLSWAVSRFRTNNLLLCGSTYSLGCPDAGPGMSIHGPVLHAVRMDSRKGQRIIELDRRGEWTPASMVNSVCFLEAGIAFVGRRGTKRNEWYGEADQGPGGLLPPDGERDKGWHAPPYEGWLWLFDPNTYQLIGEASLGPWLRTERAILHATSYPGGKKLYVMESFADFSRGGEIEPRPVIHSFDVSR